MALAIAQAAVKIKTATGSSVTSSSITFGNNLVVVGGNCWGNGAGANSTNNVVSGSVSGNFTRISNQLSGNATPHGSVHYLVVAAGAQTITFNGGTNVAGISAVIQEVSGADAAPFTTGEVAGSNTASASDSVTPNAPQATANSILFGLCGTAAGSTNTWTLNFTGSDPTTGWAHFDANCQETDAANWMDVSMPHVIVSSVGDGQRACGWDYTQTARVHDHIAIFKEGAVAAEKLPISRLVKPQPRPLAYTARW